MALVAVLYLRFVLSTARTNCYEVDGIQATVLSSPGSLIVDTPLVDTATDVPTSTR